MTTPTIDIDKLPDSVLLTRKQVQEISGFALITLKVWAKSGRGPKITWIEGRPRFRAADVRSWMRGNVACG